MSLTALNLDTSAWLASVGADYAPQTDLDADPCQVARRDRPSSLIWAGRGGLPASPLEALSLPLGRRVTGPIRGETRILRSAPVVHAQFRQINPAKGRIQFLCEQ